MNCPKARCGGTLERTDYNGVPLDVCNTCSEGYAVRGSDTSKREAAKGRSHYANKPTGCAAGHRHASKTEVRVCNRLTIQCAEAGTTLFQQPRLPLFAIAADDKNRPLYFTPDFAVVDRGVLVEVLDAKSGNRRNREWARGKAAFEATYGVKVQEVSA